MRLIDADALIDGYRHMGYDPNEHSEESYMEGWCKGFNAAVDHCIGHVIHAPTIEPERTSVSEWQKDFREYVGMLNIPRDDYNGIMEYINEVPSAQPKTIRCKECKHQIKEWRDDKRLKDKGYWVYGCKVISDICGYWALFGQDDDFCSEAERKTDGTD